MKLLDLQKQFSQLLSHPFNQDGDYSFLESSETISQEQSLEIYQMNLLGSLLKQLRNTYPRTLMILGEENFESVCQSYISDNLSFDESLDNYGKDFALFLENTNLRDEVPFLIDFVKFEFLYYLATNHQEVVEFRTEHPLVDLWKYFDEGIEVEDELETRPRTIHLWREGSNIFMQEA